jgi:predicted HicB family RNase H-like nuclease
VRDVIEIDGLKAVVTFEPEIGLFRGEFVGLCGKGGADFYAKDREQLIEEGRKSLEVHYDAMKVRAAAKVMERLVNGESPVRVWREYRGVSVEELAERAGIPADRLAEIENGQHDPDPYTTISLAEALRLDPKDLA